MQKTQQNDVHMNTQNKNAAFIIAAFVSIGAAVIFLFAVFGMWNYFNPSFVPYTFKTSSNASNEVILSGKGNQYFVTLPVQQIQLIESVSPIRTMEIQMALVVKSASDKNEIAAALPLLQDTALSYLRTMRIRDLQEMGRLFATKEALLERFNTILAPLQVEDILFQKMIIREGL